MHLFIQMELQLIAGKIQDLSSYFRTTFHMYCLVFQPSVGAIIIQCVESLYGSHRYIFNASILFKNSSKKTCELKVLFDELKGVYDIDGKGVKPIWATGTCWVDQLACVCYFHQFFIFSTNDSPSKTMKNAFYFIQKALFVLEIFKFLYFHLPCQPFR